MVSCRFCLPTQVPVAYIWRSGRTFAGTSAIFSMEKGSGRPTLLGMMGRLEEGVQIWQIRV